MRWLKWLKWISLSILLILVLIIAALSWVIGTQSGLHFALNSATRFVPELTIDKIDGDISNLTLTGVKYQMPGIDVNAGELHLALRLGCLKSRELCIDNLSTDNVMVNVDTAQLPPSEEAPASEPLTELKAPLTIRLNQLSLVSTHVNVDGMDIDLAKFTTGVTWEDKAITIIPTDIIDLAIHLPERQQDQATEEKQPDPVPINEQKSLADELKELFSKPLLAELPEIILPVNLNVEGINASNFQLTGGADVKINQLHLSLSNEGQQVLVKQLKVDAPQGNVALSGTAMLKDKWTSIFINIGREPFRGFRWAKNRFVFKGRLN